MPAANIGLSAILAGECKLIDKTEINFGTGVTEHRNPAIANTDSLTAIDLNRKLRGHDVTAKGIYSHVFIYRLCLPAAGAKRESFSDTVQYISQLWDKAFNQRDTTLYFSYVDTTFSITAGGGTTTGLQRFKLVTNRLHSIALIL